MIARILIMAATIGGAAILGRRAINRGIETQLPTEIETARAIALAEMNKEIGQVISERLFSFTLNLLIKAGLIGAVYLLYAHGHLTATGLKIVVGCLISVYLVRDAMVTLPYITPAVQMIRMHKWNPKKALIELVAGIAFERAYAEAMIATESGPHRVWIALSKYNTHNISTDVAAAVADVARTTNFIHVKARALLAAILALILIAAYSGFFLLTVGHAT
ncbi:hypothetical protein [Hyphococcus lacteus]|uniref:Uncharacterized protein n=1 Tax=Hyphococcus lacteus TaxID=3143536 RepID=A0ABV3Z5T4_9PROT